MRKLLFFGLLWRLLFLEASGSIKEATSRLIITDLRSAYCKGDPTINVVIMIHQPPGMKPFDPKEFEKVIRDPNQKFINGTRVIRLRQGEKIADPDIAKQLEEISTSGDNIPIGLIASDVGIYNPKTSFWVATDFDRMKSLLPIIDPILDPRGLRRTTVAQEQLIKLVCSLWKAESQKQKDLTHIKQLGTQIKDHPQLAALANWKGYREFILQSAIKAGDLALTEQILTHNSNLIKYLADIRTINEWLPHDLSSKDKYAFFKFFVPCNIHINKKNSWGWTILHDIVWRGEDDEWNLKSLKLLLDHHAKVNAQSVDFGTPLHIAAWRGTIEAAKLLLRGGADVNAKTETGHSPLHWAAHSGDADMAKLLLEHGANPNARLASGKTTPADLAEQYKHPKVAKIIRKAATRQPIKKKS